MQYTSNYSSPIGNILIAVDEIGLVGLWFEGQRYYASTLESHFIQKESEVICDTKRWLDDYFLCQKQNTMPKINLIGTPFQISVWKILQSVSYGKTTTYGEIAQIIAKRRGLKIISAQAIGNAVGHNPIAIIVPCHRVLGKNSDLTGYAGGIDKKIKLLELEGIQYKN